MRTDFSAEMLEDPHMRDAQKSLRACVHCGFCTATCPTYVLLGDERDSPRGRILLMQTMLQGNTVPSADTVRHIDRCLSCLGCRTTCPSGVDYAALIDTARAHIETKYKRPFADRMLRWFVPFVMMRPWLFGLSLKVTKIFAPLARLAPGRLGVMAKKVPQRAPLKREARAKVKPAEVKRRVAILSGCVQPVLAPEIDLAATRVLARGNCQCEILPDASCCGSLAYHLGQTESAKTYAKRVIEAFEAADGKQAIDALMITVTGCSAFLKDYGRVFSDEPEWHARALKLVTKVKDFSELAEISEADGKARDVTRAYHPPCSLQHAQRLHGTGEALLLKAGYTLKPFVDPHLCCGSAGTYSILQPEIASDLRARKVATLKDSGAAAIASANIGCLMHLAGEDSLPTIHIAEWLDWAQGGPAPRDWS